MLTGQAQQAYNHAKQVLNGRAPLDTTPAKLPINCTHTMTVKERDGWDHEHAGMHSSLDPGHIAPVYRPESDLRRSLEAGFRTAAACTLALMWSQYGPFPPNVLSFLAPVVAIFNTSASVGETFASSFGTMKGGCYGAVGAFLIEIICRGRSAPTVVGIFIMVFLLVRSRRLSPVGKKLGSTSIIVGAISLRTYPLHQYDISMGIVLRAFVEGGVCALIANLLPYPRLALREALLVAQHQCRVLAAALDVCTRAFMDPGDERLIAELKLTTEQLDKGLTRLRTIRPMVRLELLYLYWGQMGALRPDHTLAEFIKTGQQLLECLVGMRQGLEGLKSDQEQQSVGQYVLAPLSAASTLGGALLLDTSWRFAQPRLAPLGPWRCFGGAQGGASKAERTEGVEGFGQLESQGDVEWGPRWAASTQRMQTPPPSRPTRYDAEGMAESLVSQFQVARLHLLYGLDESQGDGHDYAADGPSDWADSESFVTTLRRGRWRPRSAFVFSLVAFLHTLHKLEDLGVSARGSVLREGWAGLRTTVNETVKSLHHTLMPPSVLVWAYHQVLALAKLCTKRVTGASAPPPPKPQRGGSKSSSWSTTRGGRMARLRKQLVKWNVQYSPTLLHPLRVALIITVASLFSFVPVLSRKFYPATWIAFTTVFIQSDSASGAVVTATLRLIGTVTGAMYGYIVADLLGASSHGEGWSWPVAVAIPLWVLVCCFFRTSKSHGYAAITAAFTAVIILLGVFPVAKGGVASPFSRIQNTIVGAFIYLVLDNLLAPVRSKTMLRRHIYQSMGLMREKVKELECLLLGGLGLPEASEPSGPYPGANGSGAQASEDESEPDFRLSKDEEVLLRNVRGDSFEDTVQQQAFGAANDAEATDESSDRSDEDRQAQPAGRQRQLGVRSRSFALQQGVRDPGDLAALAGSLKLQGQSIESAKMEPQLWHKPLHAPSYLKLLEAEHGMMSAMILMGRGVNSLGAPGIREAWLSELSKLTGVLGVARCLMRQVRAALYDAECVFDLCQDPSREAPDDHSLGGGEHSHKHHTRTHTHGDSKRLQGELRAAQAAHLLVIQAQAKQLRDAIENEFQTYLAGLVRRHAPPELSVDFVMRFNTAIFSITALTDATNKLAHAVVEMLEREKFLFYYA